MARYFNWWPARPYVAAAIARRISFQLGMAWNFLEAHHEVNLKVRFGSVHVPFDERRALLRLID